MLVLAYMHELREYRAFERLTLTADRRPLKLE